ncbi:N-acetyltransferase [Virgisporangium aliadipatigenens]|uniref:N-acetyltransferase n=1 Tax=Virgisporangium aliadipatigenens TaxID=741659 RepID=A0A8J3YNZ1_9ACTN|nr:GNAT family N-acetyltransferase [Virgisporangium aliadipatigenens]GIJ47360.1 N-acetyltransferase [Virgisporangium aliadipatigenens]
MTPDGYTLDTDPGRLDLDRIHHWLSTDAYWALGRSRDTVERAIAGSLNFGLYDPAGTQVGYARAVTDSATFAWLCDVYVERGSRGTGLGTWFVGAACAHLRDLGPRRILLATKDAHGVYAKHGFTPLVDPGMWMEYRVTPPTGKDR